MATTTFYSAENLQSSTLDGAILAGDGTLDVQAGDAAGFGALDYEITLGESSQGFEIVRATGVAGDTITATRAQGGTAALPFDSGTPVRMTPTVIYIDQVQDAINAIEDGTTRLASVTGDIDTDLIIASDKDIILHMDLDNDTVNKIIMRNGAGTDVAEINELGTLQLDGDAGIDGGDLTSTAATFNLLDVTPTTINFGGAATVVDIGAATGTTTIRNDLAVIGNFTPDTMDVGGGYGGGTGSTLDTAGNIQANGNLTIDGTSTLTGAVDCATSLETPLLKSNGGTTVITLTTDDATFADDVILDSAGAFIQFIGTNGGGGEGIVVNDTGGTLRTVLSWPGSDETRLANRGANGFVQIAANTGVGGAPGEVIVATFLDDAITFLASGGDVTFGNNILLGRGAANDGRISFGSDEDVFIHNETADTELGVVATVTRFSGDVIVTGNDLTFPAAAASTITAEESLTISADDAGGGAEELILELDGNAEITITPGVVTIDNALAVEGNVLFTTAGGGLTYGGISVKDNANADTLNSAAKVQFLDFTVNDPSNLTTPDHTNDHITITNSGDYVVAGSVTVQNSAAQAHKIDVSVWKNNGATELTNVHAHRSLDGGSTNVGSISLGPGLVTLTAADTIELWLDTDAAANRDVIVEDAVITVAQVGGP